MMRRVLILAAVTLALQSANGWAGTNGFMIPSIRSLPGSTFSGWEVFLRGTGTNNSPDLAGSAREAGLMQTDANGFVTGSGNIYNLSAASAFKVSYPSRAPEKLNVASYVNRENIKKLSALFTELSGNINTLNEILRDPNYTEFVNTECLGILLSTLYADIGPDFLRPCHVLRHALTAIRSRLRTDKEYVSEAITIASEVMRKVLKIKTMLTKGDFSEPSDVSTIVWQPVEAESKSESMDNRVRNFSTAADLSKVDMDSLRRHFLGPKG